MSPKTPPSKGANKPSHPSRRIHEEAPQSRSGKLPDNTSCPGCGAGYRKGRWVWSPPPVDAHEQLCPACERIESDYPAGVFSVEGAFATSHRDELVGLIRNIEEREKSEHPLKRIMSISDEGSGFLVKVTDSKLAESFGRALHDAYEGELEHASTTSDRENLVRVRWTRD